MPKSALFLLKNCPALGSLPSGPSQTPLPDYEFLATPLVEYTDHHFRAASRYEIM